MELIDKWNINRAAQSKNYYSVVCIVEMISPLNLARIITLTCYILYYNIEKSGFNAVYAYLLFSIFFIASISFK